MHIETTAQSFLAALKDCIKIDKNAPIPTLRSVRVTDQRIIATDLDNWTTVDFDGTGTADFLLPYHQTVGVLSGEKGKLTVDFTPGKIIGYEYSKDQIKEMIAECPGCEEKNKYSHLRTLLCGSHDPANAETGTPVLGPQSVKLSVNECEYTFESLPIANWPQMPVVKVDESENPYRSMITAEAFGTLLERTRFAISREESRYTLNGLLLEIKGNTARMVSTDGHRLSVADAKATGADLRALVPSGAVAWLLSKSGDQSVFITADETHVRFDLGDRQIITRKMTGDFPNYEAVMPRDHKAVVTIASADSLGKTLARVAKCADERSNATRWTFGPESTVAAESMERGSAKARIDCTIALGDQGAEDPFKPFTVGFAASYVGEFLKLVGDAPVKVSLSDASSAALFTAGEGWKYVVMPMRV